MSSPPMYSLDEEEQLLSSDGKPRTSFDGNPSLLQLSAADSHLTQHSVARVDNLEESTTSGEAGLTDHGVRAGPSSGVYGRLTTLYSFHPTYMVKGTTETSIGILGRDRHVSALCSYLLRTLRDSGGVSRPRQVWHPRTLSLDELRASRIPFVSFVKRSRHSHPTQMIGFSSKSRGQPWALAVTTSTQCPISKICITIRLRMKRQRDTSADWCKSRMMHGTT